VVTKFIQLMHTLNGDPTHVGIVMPMFVQGQVCKLSFEVSRIAPLFIKQSDGMLLPKIAPVKDSKATLETQH
jgi:hypothetical protein